MCPKVSKSVQKCTKVYKSVQKCTKVYKSVQKCTKVYKSVQKFIKVYKIFYKTTNMLKTGKICKIRCFVQLQSQLPRIDKWKYADWNYSTN